MRVLRQDPVWNWGLAGEPRVAGSQLLADIGALGDLGPIQPVGATKSIPPLRGAAFALEPNASRGRYLRPSPVFFLQFFQSLIF